MDQRSLIRTGDAVLFSNNGPTGFLLRSCISSMWNHGGIAVRLKRTSDGRDIVTTDLTGTLHILETNTGQRLDKITNNYIKGAALSDGEWVFRKYNRCAMRPLRDIYRTPELALRTIDFLTRYRGQAFPSSGLSFLSVWLGIPLGGRPPNEMFCTELMTRYYLYCVGPQIIGYGESTIPALFGSEAPSNEDLFAPEHYTSASTPNAPIFETNEIEIYVNHADLLYVIFQPLLLGLVVITLLANSIN